MIEVLNVDFIEMPKVCVVGREFRFHNSQSHNRYALHEQYADCVKEDLFHDLQEQHEYLMEDNIVGFLDRNVNKRMKFSYIVGMMMREDAHVPESMIKRVFGPTVAATLELKCRNLRDLFDKADDIVENELHRRGFSSRADGWQIYNYNFAKFDLPLSDADRVLDFVVQVKPLG